MATQRLKLTRKQLGAFLQDFDSIKQFERLFEIVDDADQSTINDPYGALGEVPSSDSVARALIESVIVQSIERGPESPKLTEYDQWGASQPVPQSLPADPWLLDSSRQGAWVDQYNPVYPKKSGFGIKVDIVSPSYPFVDFIGNMIPDPGGANSPVLTIISGGNCRCWAYTTSDRMDVHVHIPHDYLPGSDVFVHVHWLHNGVGISGDWTATINHQYGKGHNQGVLTAQKTVTLTYATVNVATTPQYQTRIEEVQLSTPGGSATLLDSSVLEPDGIIFLHFTLTSLPTITGGATTRVFVPYIDIHAQSTGIGTKQRAPNFYT